MNIIAKIIIVALALLLVAEFVPGIEVASFWVALIAALVLGVVNLLIRPLLIILTLPVTLLTLGLFIFVINALLFWAVGSFVDGFVVDGFIPALLGSLIVSLVSWIGGRLLADN